MAAVRHEAAGRAVTLCGDSAVVALDAGVVVTGDVADTDMQRDVPPSTTRPARNGDQEGVAR